MPFGLSACLLCGAVVLELFRAVDVLLNQRFDLRPLGEQRALHHRLDDAHDGRRVGVVRAELAALFGIEAALKQGAENRDVDGAPVFIRSVFKRGDVHRREIGDVDGFEQPTVKPRNVIDAEEPTVAHLAE